MKHIVFSLLLLTFFLIVGSCKKETPTNEITPPKMIATNPENGATNVLTSTQIHIEYDKNITLNLTYEISVNGVLKSASASGNKLLIDVELEGGINYKVKISGTSVKDITGNFADEVNFSFSCENTKPIVTTSFPENKSKNIATTSNIYIEYNQDITLAESYEITINGESKTASVSGNKVTINANLVKGKNYFVNISETSIKNASGILADAYNFTFRTKDFTGLPDNGKYEAEDGFISDNLAVASSIAGYSGSGYVGNFENADANLTFAPLEIEESYYNIYIGYSTTNNGSKLCNISINGSSKQFTLTASTSFSEILYDKIILKSTSNEIKISTQETNFYIDYIRLEKTTAVHPAFNIDASLSTPNPSSQAVNVYNFLKENFQEKVISGTMAAHATNINEATWVHNETGKWPVIAGFDFIDYPDLGQSWIDYDAIINLGTDWWNNNGLVTILWHWRDPLYKDGSFYTKSSSKPDGTEFDVSKISDINSPEYVAMLEDIDTIAGYLREFKDANIPVLWRPLHEAAGGWFWWGAKDAASCKALWQLMYNRMVIHHGLNNLIWVWTSNANSDALDWYPGHDFVDIIGMDIYAGENQHNSQYINFNKVRDFFGARKMIALTECGSVPDPAKMMLYGDTWSWFMPWNNDYTRSDSYNGATWWNKFFNYDFVLTREQMPSLK